MMRTGKDAARKQVIWTHSGEKCIKRRHSGDVGHATGHERGNKRGKQEGRDNAITQYIHLL